MFWFRSQITDPLSLSGRSLILPGLKLLVCKGLAKQTEASLCACSFFLGLGYLPWQLWLYMDVLSPYQVYSSYWLNSRYSPLILSMLQRIVKMNNKQCTDLFPVPRNCEWGQWTRWGQCDDHGNNGFCHQHRRRYVSLPALNGGQPCLGPNPEEQDATCSLDACEHGHSRKLKFA